ncbi:MAG: VCBS repeat-containing protein [Verrucomicrobia bacterium]|nr:VCBS repeat-containing protein [Verrucomicrobiota bacterium]MDA1066277.1 VCBS repeat-containing protein [Verrucomicrobiota bacterium]
MTPCKTFDASTAQFKVLIFHFGLSLLFIGCGKNEELVEKSVGEGLAQQYCIACHSFPEPDLLPKESWEFLLTYMGFFLGVVDYSYLEGSSERTMDVIEAREEFVRAAHLLPDTPMLSGEQWKMLREYYMSHAPEAAIPQVDKPKVVEDLSLFSVKSIQYRQKAAITSLVSIDEKNGFLLIHDSGAQRLTILDKDLDFHDSHEAPGVFLIEAITRDNEIYLLNIGDLFASEIGKSYGEVQHAKLRGGVHYDLKILLDNLHRPSDFSFADFQNNGVEELLVSNFGDYTGNLSLFRRDLSNGELLSEAEILSSEAGIVQSEAFDFNEDGFLDIVTMMSAARENVSIFLNQANGSFERNIIIEGNPSYGYTGLVLRDFNNDGRMDLITLNGDNGDSDPYNTLKRDQGIRIYLNQGDLKFEEAYFYPMYGVYGAEIEDFDLDGDLDIAAISFHPDFYPEKPENFVFLEQTEPLTFAPKTHPATYNGRWLTMDSGDIDGDGDKDIVLGAAYSPVGMMANHEDKFLQLVKEGPPLLFLENQTNE